MRIRGGWPVTDVQPREAELWLKQLDLSPKNRSHVRHMLRTLVDFAMWSGIIEVVRDPVDLVRVRGASKRIKQPRSLKVDEFQRLGAQLHEPFPTMARVAVCLGLRVSELLAAALERCWLAEPDGRHRTANRSAEGG